jgi:chromosome segregation ATPase
VRDEPLKTRDDSEPVAQDLDRTVEIIEDAAAAIDEMLRYNRAMKSVAAQGVAHYRDEAEAAQREAESLAAQVAELKSEKQSIADRYESRIRELEDRVAHQDRELESMRSLLWPGGRGQR